jgi:hypothetical protein
MWAMTNACRADLGFLEAGSRVTVEISGCANVRLMEPEAMVFMQFGYGYVFYGGLYGPGTVTLEVPDDGYWWHVVDVVGLNGPVSVSSLGIERRHLLPV